MKYTVALTGGIGSGKSTVSNFFQKQGITIVDADVIAREVVAIGSKGLTALVSLLGESILSETGDLNRPILRNKMFGDTPAHQHVKMQVNSILHPLIQEKTKSYIEHAVSQYVIWVVPLLFENNLQSKANRILVVDVPEEIQISRTINRDKVSESHVKYIIQAQYPRHERIKNADDVINGNQTLDVIEHEVIMLHQKYLALSQI